MAKKNQNHIAVLFIDIDRFKSVNDTLGHTVGDQLLQDIAKRLTFNLQKPNTVARFGGDEFIVILPDEDNLHRLENYVLSILKHLETPYNLNGHKVFASASIGVSVYPYDGDDTETLLRKADNAMHKAKEKGRNNVQFFTMEMDIEAQRRQELEQDLHKAIAKKQLSLNYQPIIDAQTGMIVSAEALVRWKHPKKGFISPDDFIPLAEEVGIITSIGEWVLREACKTASHWTAEAGSIPSVSVNLSSIQFQKQDIPTLVKNVLLETGLPARRLTLEITESLLVNDDHNTLKQLQQIRSLGVGLSIDDFGTGYSSLSYLKKFPVSTLKIDRSFITGLPKNTEDKALVSAIMGIARSLSLSVVAEGVETQEQADLLTKEGCQRFQGYLFSKPLPRLEFETLLQRQEKKINVL
ncbi:Sensory box/GGDEF family protein [gamma proteobacterium IMCC2047]|nr:Sensory box/GGDEF family protein [gamma proteobacterium IMCC2047]